MESVEKLKKLVSSQRFIDKVGEFNASMFMEFLDKDYLPYANRELIDIGAILHYLGFSESEKTEINAYLYNKIFKLYNGNSYYKDEYIKFFGENQSEVYDNLCIKVKLLRAYIDEDGNILPCPVKPTKQIIRLFQTFCENKEEIIIKIIKLSNKKAEEAIKKVEQQKQGAIQLLNIMEDLKTSNKFYNAKEIERIKKLMRKLNYSPEEIQEWIEKFEKNNSLYQLEHPKAEESKKIQNQDYKLIKSLTHELNQYIDDNDKPYDYMSEKQIEEVIQLLTKLNYTETRKNVILNNISKSNGFIKQNEILEVQNQIKMEIFNEIDTRNDKRFTASSSETYDIAIKYETKIEDLNNRINAALGEIQNSIINLVDSTEEKDFYIEYIMEALSEIDQCFARATEWNLVKERKK